MNSPHVQIATISLLALILLRDEQFYDNEPQSTVSV